MKIAAISLYPAKSEKHVNTSGVASYTKNLLKKIPLSAEDSLYIVCNKDSPRPTAYKEDGFYIRRVFSRNFSFVWSIYKETKKINPDVVHVQQEIPLYGPIYTACMLPILLCLLRRYKVVVTLHHVVSLQKIDRDFVRSNKSSLPVWVIRLAFLIIYKSLVAATHKAIVHENYFKTILIKEYCTKARKIVVIHHGVENFTAQPTQKARSQLKLSPDRRVVLFMGYLAGYKGLDLLIKGFAEYAKTDSKAMLIIGAGVHPKFANDPTYLQEYADMQQTAASLISVSQHQWIGFIPENKIDTYYSASDVTVYPYTISMSSSGPMSFAMGYKKPFLASDVFADVLPKELLFARTPHALSQKLTYFFANSAQFAEFSAQFKAARLWSTVGKNTKLTYERLLS